MQKSRKFIETWLYQEQRPFEENETAMKKNLYFNRKLKSLVYRDLKLQVNSNIIGKSQKSINIFQKTIFFSKAIANKSFQLKDRQLVWQLLGKQFKPVISEIKSKEY